MTGEGLTDEFRLPEVLERQTERGEVSLASAPDDLPSVSGGFGAEEQAGGEAVNKVTPYDFARGIQELSDAGTTQERADICFDAILEVLTRLRTCPSEIKDQVFDECGEFVWDTLANLPDEPTIEETEMENELGVPPVFGRED